MHPEWTRIGMDSGVWHGENNFLPTMENDRSQKTWRKKLKQLEISHIRTSNYNPTGNSISERINAHISTVLRMYKGAGNVCD